jgi:DNA-binding response OmpR family regulator
VIVPGDSGRRRSCYNRFKGARRHGTRSVNHPFRKFQVDLEAGELRRNGTRIKLQEQPLQVLTALLARPGSVVTRKELRERIWADHTFVDFEPLSTSNEASIKQICHNPEAGEYQDSEQFVGFHCRLL